MFSIYSWQIYIFNSVGISNSTWHIKGFFMVIQERFPEGLIENDFFNVTQCSWNRNFQAGRKESESCLPGSSLAETIPQISESGRRSNKGDWLHVRFHRVEFFVTGDLESRVSCDSDTKPERWLDLGSWGLVSTNDQTQVVVHNFGGDNLYIGQTQSCFYR